MVLDFFNNKNFNPEYGKEFFEYYEERQWQTSEGSDVRDWRALAKYWVEQKSLIKQKKKYNKKHVSQFRDNLRTTKIRIMDKPSKITEGGVEYSLGKFDGSCVHYDFPKILTYLDVKGKLLFGKKFKIYKKDKKILLKLCSYFIRDKASCDKYGIDINKGILLSGPVGKTALMKLLKHIVPMQRPYEMIPFRKVTFSFNHLGYKTIEEYGSSKFFCFDDLGVEPPGRFYGKDLNVMGEVLLSRYDLYMETKRKIKTPCNHQPKCPGTGEVLWK